MVAESKAKCQIAACKSVSLCLPPLQVPGKAAAPTGSTCKPSASSSFPRNPPGKAVASPCPLFFLGKPPQPCQALSPASPAARRPCPALQPAPLPLLLECSSGCPHYPVVVLSCLLLPQPSFVFQQRSSPGNPMASFNHFPPAARSASCPGCAAAPSAPCPVPWRTARGERC